MPRGVAGAGACDAVGRDACAGFAARAGGATATVSGRLGTRMLVGVFAAGASGARLAAGCGGMETFAECSGEGRRGAWIGSSAGAEITAAGARAAPDRVRGSRARAR